MVSTEPKTGKSEFNIVSPRELRVFQRREDNEATIIIEGTCTGAYPGTVVEACTVLEDGKFGTPIDWTVIDPSPDSRSYRGGLKVPAGGWYQLRVRIRAGDNVLAESKVNRVGVGEVFITAGQSNSANYGSAPQVAYDDRVSAYTFNGSWQVGHDPQPGATGEGGTPWPIVASMLAESLQVPIGLVSTGFGGTAIEMWKPGTELYKHLLDAAKGVGAVRCVLWHQGESDAYNGTSTKEYFDGLSQIIRQTGVDSGHVIPWMVAQVSIIHTDKSAEAAVAEAQRLLWQEGVALQGPCTDDIIGPDYRYDGLHFSAKGLRVHAHRWFAMIWSQFFATCPLK